jgi:hypothetical protein
MDALYRLLRQIGSVASQHGMSAYIVGSAKWVPASHDHVGYFDDGRLLKLSPIGVPSRPLLEIELNDGLRLYKHIDSELTRRYKGRSITTKWVIGFIEANAENAQHISDNQPTPKSEPEPEPEPPPKYVQYTQKERDGLHKTRREVICQCRGNNEDCRSCFGSGHYTVDGLGNRV